MKRSAKTTLNRRKFITASAISVGGLALSSVTPAFTKILPSRKQYTVQNIIDLIMKEGNLLPIKGTVDTLKSGEPGLIVTGIVTTMFATVEVIKEAAKLGANFIIAHEPTFYNHRDDINWVNNNDLARQKQALLKAQHTTVWRCHDYIHSLKPDAMLYGAMKKLNWLPYFTTNTPTITIPQTSLAALVKHLKTSLGITHLRIIGDLNQYCSRVTYLPGAPGGQMQVSVAINQKPDVLIVGELSEWETAEYIRDARLLGSKISLIILGHNMSEDPGMDYFVDWLQPKLTDLKVQHVPSGDPFTWL
ncbi:Nif3-like dinuclear metal center hexameric protein [Mucilaginibacter sp. AK015]|uniref:Nif3-like dinuclear metal center hexameric protein n=1 Tax=Mucilaginibacter sp. AK015 TaxID=2723072 RepID=UPI00161786E7|nr:Nif3-like dinuclear metal center hexameric protein [Mucilaginibacter sp. AK015]MBB5394686.1 putative NIF3 family GTP cyclohydrolase 1 type 2 [Mucilaginibacter sp. AK015]